VKAESRPWDGHRVVPLVVIERADDVNKVMDALLAGGISILEIALRTPAALEAIKIASARGDFTVAAGTVTSSELVSKVIDAGANFGLSPAAQDSVLNAARDRQWPFLPGIATPSEAARMADRGLSHVKVYPTDLIGGEKFLDALAQVMPSLQLLPSGGVSEQNLASLLSRKNVFAVSGSWIATKTDISEQKFNQITERASKALELAKGND
jgi:2-dehydro-3-deoxyphosphogluconate aldolase/(4S)-4-hydroxy-2-oxoglutarate aldolase